MSLENKSNEPKANLIKTAMDALVNVELFTDKIEASKKLLQNIKKLPNTSN